MSCPAGLAREGLASCRCEPCGSSSGSLTTCSGCTKSGFPSWRAAGDDPRCGRSRFRPARGDGPRRRPGLRQVEPGVLRPPAPPAVAGPVARGRLRCERQPAGCRPAPAGWQLGMTALCRMRPARHAGAGPSTKMTVDRPDEFPGEDSASANPSQRSPVRQPRRPSPGILRIVGVLVRFNVGRQC